MICAALGLACMFGGVWLGDSEVLSAVDLPNATLAMRLITLAVYVAFFFLAQSYSRKDAKDVRRFFGATTLVGLAAFALGVVLALVVAPAMPQPGSRAAALGGLLLTKVIGAPISVAMTWVFALLDRTAVIRACSLGMFGAFALYSAFEMLALSGALSTLGVVIVAFGLLSASMLFGILSMGSPVGRAFSVRSSSEAVPPSLALPGVVKRPFRKVLTPGLAIVIVFSAIMLGFSRNGVAGQDLHANPVALSVLLALIVVAVLWRGLLVEHVFYAALACAAVGALASPLFDPLAPGAMDVLSGLGAALFEVVMWALVVWVARNSTETLVAAAAARLVAVVGHLVGTVIVVAVAWALAGAAGSAGAAGAGVAGSAGVDPAFAGELVVIMAYIALLMVLLKFPSMQVPFMTPIVPAEVAADAESLAKPDRPAAEQADPAEAERRVWVEPCDTIAATYKLTAREREVLEFIARGRDMPFIEEELVISRNTLKMHIRHIYTKLDAHSKQDIIDMVEQVRG